MDLIIPHFYGIFFQDKCSKNRASISSLHHMCNYPTGIILFHENSPRASDRFQLSHLLLSSFWGGLLWERGEGIVLVETGSKIIPGAAHPLPWKPKNGMCTEIPSPAGNLGGFIPDRIGRVCSCSSVPGFELWLVVPHWGMEHLQHVWILGIPSLGLFLRGILGAAPKSRILRA